MLISDQYREMNTQLHADKEQYGRSGKKWAATVKGIIGQIKAESVLDYGCGKATLEKELGEIITSYDPAIPERNQETIGQLLPHDLVVCTDVLEHVEPGCLSAVVGHISELAQKAIFLTVATRPAKKELPDGRNAHLIIRSGGWWVEFLSLFIVINQINIDPNNGDLIIFGEPK